MLSKKIDNPNGKKIIVIEDDPFLADIYLTKLKQSNYQVEVASTGEDGLLWLKDKKYDVLLLDIVLPKMDGWTILKELRKSGSAVPVLILTARDALTDRVRGLDSGADDYLAKPFGFIELLARVKALLRRDFGSGEFLSAPDGAPS